ncbi:hypothetical protein HUJ04_012474 [Dendroctonus ponderosae]|nr:hypothetical protein HUJ04_012474 [Dendroctonus ponderosae]
MSFLFRTINLLVCLKSCLNKQTAISGSKIVGGYWKILVEQRLQLRVQRSAFVGSLDSRVSLWPDIISHFIVLKFNLQSLVKCLFKQTNIVFFRKWQPICVMQLSEFVFNNWVNMICAVRISALSVSGHSVVEIRIFVYDPLSKRLTTGKTTTHDVNVHRKTYMLWKFWSLRTCVAMLIILGLFIKSDRSAGIGPALAPEAVAPWGEI